MEIVYIVTEVEHGDVIIAASSKVRAIEQLHKYTGYGSENNNVVFLGFKEYDFGGDFLGAITYDCKYGNDEKYSKSTFHLHGKILDELSKDKN